MQVDKTNVFNSDITRDQQSPRNNLYELIKVSPASATPTQVDNDENGDCDFMPKTDKHYIPKTRSKAKVKTVRNVRNIYEKDVYDYLPNDLERQQHMLLKKITSGSARNENTKILAKNILKSDNAISRSSWQMLMNVNPEDHFNAVQYVLWNGKRIRVNGSKGGKNKFICPYDLASKNKCLEKKTYVERNTRIRKQGLLRNSLNIKFKPGPLRRKKSLDVSYQKYNVGNTELIKLPKPGIIVQPTYGVTLEPTIHNIIRNNFDPDGKITEKLAEFSVSVLGKVKNNEAVQDKNNDVTFELNYKSNQQRLLMRQNIDNTCINTTCSSTPKPTHVDNVFKEVDSVLKDMISAVEINIRQNDLFSGVDEPRESALEDVIPANQAPPTKEKQKKKLNELDRLDVTIIRLPENPLNVNGGSCSKPYCTLGCICNSLQCNYNLKQHCGNKDCMFKCKCGFTNYKVSQSLEKDCSELIPGLLNLNNQINLRLTKEEKKFHQTVVVTGEKSILLKSEKRNWKATKRYSEFYNDMYLKTEMKPEKTLSIMTVNLKCKNIEPWCMVHNLYKCFCRGMFIEKLILDKPVDETKSVVPPIAADSSLEEVSNMRPRAQLKKPQKYSISEPWDNINQESGNTSARVRKYKGRKYYESYYKTTNAKILQMEKNDAKLQSRMISLINGSNFNRFSITDSEDSNEAQMKHMDVDDSEAFNYEIKEDICLFKENYKSLQSIHNEATTSKDNPSSATEIKASDGKLREEKNSDPILTLNPMEVSDQKLVQNPKTKLMSWLESSYKQYKLRLEQGNHKTSLDPPKQGKLALYAWDFILRRYKERKNLFMISKDLPYRIFMAVDVKNPFFVNCQNINDIRFADLHKYPTTIKNLLTSATDLKDTFFILCGLSHCWELIGSVTKLNEYNTDSKPTDISGDDCSLTSNLSLGEEDELSCDQKPNDDILVFETEDGNQSTVENDLDVDTSKWFVMTLEGDFSEIQFFKRGFFVKYESIIKAINVARMTEKTVRLSSQKKLDHNGDPQFGIYAIPNTVEYCVFVGPYDKDEPLGIETIKSVSQAGKGKRTRGVWITTKKVDNSKVLDNPLSFMPSSDPREIVPLEDNTSSNNSIETFSELETIRVTPITNLKKVVKPIKIRRTNGFYHLAPKGLLQPLPLPTSPNPNSLLLNSTVCNKLPPLLSQTSILCPPPPLLIRRPDINTSNLSLPTIENKKPVAEIAPQIKIVDVYSEACPRQNKRSEGGMFILKPEEINERLMLQTTTARDTKSVPDVMNEDIENFLATSEVCDPPNADVYVVSDEDEASKDVDRHKCVWIESINVENLGWLQGRRNSENHISFEFPGFKYTEFYEEKEAFSKIHQVLSRKIYVPKSLKLLWRVVDSEDKLTTNKKLKSGDLGNDFVLTKKGPRHKTDFLNKHGKKLGNSSEKLSPSSSCHDGPTGEMNMKGNVNDLISDLEIQSQTLENEGHILLKEFIMKGNVMKTLYSMDSEGDQFSDSLQAASRESENMDE